LIVPTAHLTRIVEFTATHRIRRPDWPDTRNEEEFGKAARDHAHRYQVRVTVKGPLAPEEGGITSLVWLDRLLREEVTERFDGRHFNHDVPDFGEGGLLPTGEAIAVYVWERLAARLPAGLRLHAVRVQEGPTLYSEYFGEP
jgi:6-pyruvoyltetrahydropterin/6-carboxytetrahydropterin synthase